MVSVQQKFCALRSPCCCFAVVSSSTASRRNAGRYTVIRDINITTHTKHNTVVVYTHVLI